jgi:uncharacterized alkaline shock family protein YloU
MNEILGEGNGTVAIAASALQQIVVQAVESVEGVRLHGRRRRLGLEIVDGHARAELELRAAYGLVLPEIARAVQERVTEALAGMCGFVVDAVDVSVEELDR